MLSKFRSQPLAAPLACIDRMLNLPLFAAAVQETVIIRRHNPLWIICTKQGCQVVNRDYLLQRPKYALFMVSHNPNNLVKLSAQRFEYLSAFFDFASDSAFVLSGRNKRVDFLAFLTRQGFRNLYQFRGGIGVNHALLVILKIRRKRIKRVDVQRIAAQDHLFDF